VTVDGTRLDNCGCCGVAPEETVVTNTPGLSALAYRSVTHSSVLRRMLDGLAARLPTLVARTTDDAGVALLDAWATVADVVTFYQERIANEGYLRTATERRSVLELARAIGYELRPGVAAGTYLDFRVETAPGAPTSAVVAQGTRVRSVPGQDQLPQTFETSEAIIADVARNEIPLRRHRAQVIGAGRTSLYLAGVNTGLRPGDAILVFGGTLDRTDPRWDFRIVRTVDPHPAGIPGQPSTTLVTWDDPLVHDYPKVEVHAFRLRAALFGYNAPDWRTLPNSVRRRYVTTAAELSDTHWPGFELPAPSTTKAIDLDAAYPALGVGSWLVLRQPNEQKLYKVVKADLSAREDYGISSKTTRLELDSADALSSFDLRAAAVYAQTELMTLADEPIGGTTAGPEFLLDRPAPLVNGQPVIVVGATGSGAAVAQVAWVRAVTPTGDTATVTLDPAPITPLTVESVRIRGNVVAATHGETVPDEVLGSGDGTATHQRFALKKKELTHLSAHTPKGVVDTLEVRVDGVAWSEAPSLFTAGPSDHSYVVRIDDDAQATVIFGDGERGARLPTGQENVHARYRSGIGPAGDVDAGTLTLLPQRPFGISAVSNPMRAAGGTPPERLADARVNAPLAVLTLDRVVSLRDYEDYARAYGGIAKARAVALWAGTSTFVHLTVAGPKGTTVDSRIVGNLLGAFETVRDPARAVRVDGYQSKLFRVGVAVLVDPAHVTAAVHLAVRNALLAAYAVDRRSFGQPVTAAEVITVVQAVRGVVAARLTALHLKVGDPPIAEVIVAHDARIDSTSGAPDRVVPAELLLVDPDHIEVAEMTP